MITSTNTQILNAQIVIKIIQDQPNFFKKFKIKNIAIFGSTARNEATENSDLNFLVEFNCRATLKGYMSLKFYLEELFNKKVDLVTINSLIKK